MSGFNKGNSEKMHEQQATDCDKQESGITAYARANHSLAVGRKISGKRIMVRPKVGIMAQCIHVLTRWAEIFYWNEG